MRVFKCEFLGLIQQDGREVNRFPVPYGVRARVKMKEDHDRDGARNGGTSVTSAVKMIDFERCIIVTQNNVYDFSSELAVNMKLLETIADFDRFFARFNIR